MGQSASSTLDLTPQGGISAKHTQAWLSFLSFAGSNSAALGAAIQKLVPQSSSSIAPSATIALNDLLNNSKLTQASAAPLLDAFEAQGGNLALVPLLQTRVSREDLLIVLNLFLEDVAAAEFNADEMDESSPTAASSSSSSNSVPPSVSPDSLLAHIAPARLVAVQEKLDALVEEAGPQAEGQAIPKGELQKVLKAAGVPLIQWALFATTFAQSVKEQGLEGEADAAPATASSSSAAGKKPASSKAASSSSGGAAGGFGGGLDLSISGFSIKPPAGFNAGTAPSSAAPKKK